MPQFPRQTALKIAAWVSLALAAALSPAAMAQQAPASEKMALLIGNSGYPGTPAKPAGWGHLANPVNDVTLVGEKLGDIGFDVTMVEDGDWKTLDAAVDAFARRSKGAKLVLFYFAGHGFEYDRRNYLVPVDAPSSVPANELPGRFLDFERLANRLATAQTTIFLLDACRTGAPFVTVAPAAQTGAAPVASPMGTSGSDGARGTVLGGGAVMRGVNDYDFPPGAQVAVLYSTGRGIPARDAAPPPANYSPFAWEVAQRISVPHVEVSTVFNAIRQGVYDRTRHFAPPQAPYTYNSLAPDVFLTTAADRIALARPTTAPATQPATGPASGPESGRLAISAADLERVDEPVLMVRVLSEHSVAEIARMVEGGDPLATYLLGYMQEFGLGVPRDLVKARATLERAAAYGTPSGQLEYAYFLHHHASGPADRQRAVELYRAAAAQGFAKARGHYAGVLMAGQLVDNTPANYEAGLEQLRLAAKADYPYALYSLALADAPARQGEWQARLQALADGGDADAHHWLCTIEVGRSRRAAAIPHCAIAAAAGFPDSQAQMALAANEGWTQPRSTRDALHWMRQALSRPDLDDGSRAQMLSLRMELQNAATN